MTVQAEEATISAEQLVLLDALARTSESLIVVVVTISPAGEMVGIGWTGGDPALDDAALAFVQEARFAILGAAERIMSTTWLPRHERQEGAQ